MKFDEAFRLLMSGEKIRRRSWWQPEEYLYHVEGVDDCVAMHMIDPEEMESDEFMVAWEDILADDWEVVDEDHSEWKELNVKWKEMDEKWREME